MDEPKPYKVSFYSQVNQELFHSETYFFPLKNRISLLVHSMVHNMIMESLGSQEFCHFRKSISWKDCLWASRSSCYIRSLELDCQLCLILQCPCNLSNLLINPALFQLSSRGQLLLWDADSDSKRSKRENTASLNSSVYLKKKKKKQLILANSVTKRSGF